jgi:predicted nucleic acid-binding protein
MIVLDANILIRAVLGRKVLSLLLEYAGTVDFVAPDLVLREARRELPAILSRRSMSIESGMATLESICGIVLFIDVDHYAVMEEQARRRLFRRDQDDWPILATALRLDLPIWTQDMDFFGCGVATWTTDLVDIYLSEVSTASPPNA